MSVTTHCSIILSTFTINKYIIIYIQCHAGELLSVAPWVVRQVPSLFALSERVLLGGYWEHGFFSLTAVGAYNVGSIEVDMDKVSITIIYRIC